jgi:hypothetical protein
MDNEEESRIAAVDARTRRVGRFRVSSPVTSAVVAASGFNVVEFGYL